MLHMHRALAYLKIIMVRACLCVDLRYGTRIRDTTRCTTDARRRNRARPRAAEPGARPRDRCAAGRATDVRRESPRFQTGAGRLPVARTRAFRALHRESPSFLTQSPSRRPSLGTVGASASYAPDTIALRESHG